MIDTPPVGDHELLTAAGAPQRVILVVANQTASSFELVAELCHRAHHGPVLFHLVVPALNSRLRHWLSDIDDALSTARRCGNEALAVLESHGLTSSVEIGDSAPLLAIEDALAQRPVEEIVISTLPVERSHWLERDLVDRARARFGIPVRHVIADVDVTRCCEPSRDGRRLTRRLRPRRTRREPRPALTS